MMGTMDSTTARCATCKHYQAPTPGDWSEPFGTCTRVPDTGSMADDRREWTIADADPNSITWNEGKWLSVVRPRDLAYTADASGYRSGLHVRPEFGCVLHDPVDVA